MNKGPIAEIVVPGPSQVFDVGLIIKAVEAADMKSNVQFHDMMEAFFGETHPGEGCLFDHLAFAQELNVSDSAVKRWSQRASAPRIDAKKNLAKKWVLQVLQAMIKE